MRLALASLLFTYLLVIANSATDIASLNCPNDFNVTVANVTTGVGNSQIAAFFFSPFTSPETVAQVQDIIIKADKTKFDTYVTGVLIIPYIAIGVAFFIAFFIVICCTIFQKSCPPCHSWRRDFMKRPYEKFQIRCVAFFTVFFAIGILAASIASFVVIPSMDNQIKYTKCAIYSSINVALNGDNNHWGGYSHIKNQVGNISELLSNASSKVSNYFSDNATVGSAMQDLKRENLNIYNQNQDAQVVTPNPTTTAASPTLPLVDSYFIQNSLGPNGTADTMVDDIYNELVKTQKLSDQAEEVVNSAYILVNSANTIKSNTQAGQRSLSLYQDQLNALKDNMDVLKTNFFDSIQDWGIYVIQVIIGFILVASLAIIIGTVSTSFLEMYDCRYFIHFGWVIYGLAYFGVVFIVFLMLSYGSLGYTFCQYYSGFLTDQNQFSRIGDYYLQSPLTKLDTCLYGDGDVLQKFDVSQEMTTVSNLFTNINLFNDYDDSTSPNYVDAALSSQQILDWNTTINEYRLGIIKDVNPLLSNDDNAVIALESMNSFTNQYSGAPFPHCSKDRWVYDVADCTNSSQLTYVTPATEDEGTTIHTSYVTCISLNEKLYQSSPSNWTERDIAKRYVQIREDCPHAYNNIQSYAQSITNYRDSRQNLFQSINQQLTNLQLSHTTFDSELSTFRNSLSAFSSQEVIVSLSNLVTNENSGLLVSSDCRPIGDQMRFFYNTFCHNFMGQVVQLGLTTIVLLCLMIGGLFTACIYAQRIATVKRLYTVHEKLHLNEDSVHSETFEKKQKSQSDSSSSSSEQD